MRAGPRPAAHRRLARSVHRRLWIVRALEAAGTTAALLAVAVAVAVPLARHFDRSAAVAILLLVAVALVAAVLRLAQDRPTLAAAAALADRRFGWDDLLSSAVATTDGGDPFAAAVRATADARCRGVRPSAVPVARVGRRGWVAITTTVAVATGVTLLPVRSMPSASDPTDQANAAALTADADQPTVPPTTPRPPSPRRTGTDAIVERGSPPVADAAPTASSASQSHSSPPHRPAAGGTGRGSASSLRDTATDPADAASTTAHGEGGTRVAGGGRGGRPASVGPDGPTGLTTTADLAAAAAPWRSPGWDADRRSAAAAVAAGTVPARDRQLVRDYFDRGDGPR